MRIEVIRCDVCHKEHDAQYMLPTDWIRTIQRVRFDDDEEKHFCSLRCLIQWAEKKEEDE